MKQLRTILFCVAALLMGAAAVWASGDAHEAHEAPNWMNLVWRCVNFVAVVAVVYYLAGAKIANTFGGRKLAIVNQLADLEERKVSTKARLVEVERSIANLEQEKAQILADYKAQGEALKASILAAAEEQAAKIKAQALVSAEQESKMAIETLRAAMADKVVEAARTLLVEKLTAEAQDKLVEDALGKVVLN